MSFEARKTDPDNPHDSRGLPAYVVSATVRLLDGLTGEFIELGGIGDFDVAASTTLPTGLTANDTGSIVSYLLPSAFTAVPGDFTIFVRCVFDDDSVLTEDRKIKVNEYR